MKRKTLNALLGLLAGVVSFPFAVFAWPVFLAWYMWSETDGDEEAANAE